ncbi:hypothetical protein Noda2021_03580 [Candidatus Dependentiae bacterium Noda2021]|nr:hypothetical protein Noda2021_03580 [Candidatus Dependentiae bacterium Noda2021]
MYKYMLFILALTASLTHTTVIVPVNEQVFDTLLTKALTTTQCTPTVIKLTVNKADAINTYYLYHDGFYFELTRSAIHQKKFNTRITVVETDKMIIDWRSIGERS